MSCGAGRGAREENAGNTESLASDGNGFERANGLPMPETGSQTNSGRCALPRGRRQLRPAARTTSQGPRGRLPCAGLGAGSGGVGGGQGTLCWGTSPLDSAPPAPSSPLPPAPSADPVACVCPLWGQRGPRAPEPRAPSPARPSPHLLQGVPRDPAARGESGGRGALGTGPLARRVRSLAPRGCVEPPRVGRRIREPWASLTAGSRRTDAAGIPREGN